jgi:hypothetical protein
VIGSTKPETIIALATATERPRLMRKNRSSYPIYEPVAS